jgi:V8-like Glu-specific endopeptidase
MAQINLTKPSIQSLLVRMSVNGLPLSTGTGFVCIAKSGRPVLITNRHNVTGRNQLDGQPMSKTGGIPDTISILHNRKGALGNWDWKSQSLDNSPWHEHPALGAKADFVALPLTELADTELYPYEIKVPIDVMIRPAERISVVGFPFGIQAGGSLAVWATGFIASEPDINFDGLPIFLVDCRTRPGQSGSAVIFHDNGGLVNFANGSMIANGEPTTRLLGVYSGRINAESDIGMVWKASAIAELLTSI